MKIVSGVLRVALAAFLVWLCAGFLGDRYQGSFGPPDWYPFERGNAPEDVRAEIIETLEVFQQGYTARDVSLAVPFAERLFAPDNISILGTMPQEIYIGLDSAIDLVRSDWQNWGDCRFAVENAHVSSSGDVAWFSTVGYVEFDLTSLLVLPLRLSGALVKDDGEWRMQHLQFQFDLDLTPILLIIVLLAMWFVVELMGLILQVARTARAARASEPDRAANTPENDEVGSPLR